MAITLCRCHEQQGEKNLNFYHRYKFHRCKTLITPTWRNVSQDGKKAQALISFFFGISPKDLILHHKAHGEENSFFPFDDLIIRVENGIGLSRVNYSNTFAEQEKILFRNTNFKFSAPSIFSKGSFLLPKQRFVTPVVTEILGISINHWRPLLILMFYYRKRLVLNLTF